MSNKYKKLLSVRIAQFIINFKKKHLLKKNIFAKFLLNELLILIKLQELLL